MEAIAGRTRVGHPKRLTERHRLVALMLAAGRTNVEVAHLTGLSPNRVSILRTSPLFQQLVEQERETIRRQAVEAVIHRLNGQAGPTLDTLINLRDQRQNLQVALGAANSLFDRVVPRQTAHEETRTLAVQFSRADVHDMLSVLAERGDLPLERLASASRARDDPPVIEVTPRPVVALDDAVQAADLDPDDDEPDG